MQNPAEQSAGFFVLVPQERRPPRLVHLVFVDVFDVPIHEQHVVTPLPGKKGAVPSARAIEDEVNRCGIGNRAFDAVPRRHFGAVVVTGAKLFKRCGKRLQRQAREVGEVKARIGRASEDVLRLGVGLQTVLKIWQTRDFALESRHRHPCRGPQFVGGVNRAREAPIVVLHIHLHRRPDLVQVR